MKVYGHDIHSSNGTLVATWGYDHANFSNGGGIVRITRTDGTFFHADSVESGLSLFTR